MVRSFALVKSIQNIKVDFLNWTKKKKVQRNKIVSAFNIKIYPFQRPLFKQEKLASKDEVKYQSKLEQVGNYSLNDAMDQQFGYSINPPFQDCLQKVQYKLNKAKIFRQFTNKKLSINDDYQPIRVPSNHITMVENQLKKAITPLKKQLESNSSILSLSLKPRLKQSGIKQKKYNFDSDQNSLVAQSSVHIYKQSETEQKQNRQMQVKVIQHVLKHGIDNAEIEQKFGMKGYRQAFYLLKKINRRGITFLKNMAVSMKLRDSSYPKQHSIDKIGGACLSKIGSKQSNDDEKIVRLRSIILRLILTLGKKTKQAVKKQQIAEGVQLLDELQEFIKRNLKVK